MAWTREGDNGATHPALLKVETDPDWDDRLVNEAYGFFERLVKHSAGHMTDGVIDQGAAILIGNRARWELLIRTCVRAGMLTVHRRGKNPAWKIIDDPDFVHIRSKAEIEWERARQLDIANPRLIVAVKHRDGDACRYCGVIVSWRAKRGDRRGSYDHRPPGKRATSPDCLVVCCLNCNQRRGGRPLAEADADIPLMAPPSSPFYSETTIDYLARHGVHVTASSATSAAQQPGSSSHKARPESAGTAAGPRAAAEAPHTDPDPPPETGRSEATGSADVSKKPVYGSGRVGTGRDGTGPVGTGGEPGSPRRKRRGSRGRRGGQR